MRGQKYGTKSWQFDLCSLRKYVLQGLQKILSGWISVHPDASLILRKQ